MPFRFISHKPFCDLQPEFIIVVWKLSFLIIREFIKKRKLLSESVETVSPTFTCATFEFSTVMIISVTLFWDVTPCSLQGRYCRLG